MIKPANDKSKYRIITLLNQMKVFLIQSDDQVSGARIKITAGSNQEIFNQFNGLAHLLEHILYNGDPSSSNKVSDILSKSQGDTNAVTNDKETDFYFTCQKNFEYILERWSKGFYGAQIQEQDIKREIQAVNSEYINSQSEDQWHYQEQLRKCSNPQNPFYRFNMGSLKTMPLNQTKDILKETIKYYQKYYTSDKMSLMLVSNMTLNDLEDLANKYFGFYKPNNNLKIKYDYNSFYQDLLGKFIYIQSRKNQNLLSLVFPIENTFQHQNKKISIRQGYQFLKKLIEMPDQSGFIHNLQQKNWVLDYSGGNVWKEPHDFDLFQVKLLLSDQGLRNSIQIINSFFKFINQISENSNNESLINYHNQLSFLSYLQFYYSEMITTKEYISKFNNWSQIEDKQNILLQNLNVFYDYDQLSYKLLLDQIIPEKCLVIFLSHAYQLNKQNNKIRFKKTLRQQKIIQNKEDEEYLQDDFFKLDALKINDDKISIKKLNNIKNFLNNQQQKIQQQDDDVIFKNLKYYNQEMNYYFNDLKFPKQYMEQFQKMRHTYIEDQIQFQSLKYLTQNLNIVSNCKLQQIFEFQSSKPYNAIQDKIIKPSSFTNEINTLIEARAQARYDENCFQKEIIDQDLKIKKIIDDQFTSLAIQTIRTKMLPFTAIKIQFESPLNTQDDQLLFKFLILMIQNSIMEEQKKIELSGNKLSIQETNKQIYISINAYSDQAEKILQFIIEKLTNLNFIQESSFQVAKLYLEVEYTQSKSISKQIKYIYNNIINMEFTSSQQKIDKLKTINLQNIIDYHQKYFSSLFIKQYYSGNILDEQALKLYDIIKNKIQIKNAIQRDKLQKQKLIKVKPQQNIIYRDFNQIEDDKNHAVLNYYQIQTHNPEKEKAIMLFLERLISSESFKYLREMNNLGYIAQGSANEKSGVLGVQILVQGSEKDPIQMDYYIELFLQYFYDCIEKMTDQEFKMVQMRFIENDDNNYISFKQNLNDIIQKFENDDIQHQNSQQYLINKEWDKLSQIDFITRNNRVTMRNLKQLQKSDLLSFWKDQMLDNQKKISIQLFSKQKFSQIPQKFDMLTNQNIKLYIGNFNNQEQISY